MSEHSDETSLEEHLDRLTGELRQYTSYRAALLRGIVYGVGTALGASIVAALLVTAGYYLARPIAETHALPALSRDALQAMLAQYQQL